MNTILRSLGFTFKMMQGKERGSLFSCSGRSSPWTAVRDGWKESPQRQEEARLTRKGAEAEYWARKWNGGSIHY